VANISQIICVALVFTAFATSAQKKYTIEKGEIDFASNATLELIKATSTKIQGIVDPKTGQFAFIVSIKSFEGFKSTLQKEHFNEKYLESDRFFDATFTGKIVEPVDFSKDGELTVNAKGTLVVHGKKVPRTIPSKMIIDKGKLRIESTFSVPLADHDIKIPTIVTEKIATEILIHLNVSMIQK
jgi:polyisoprenoid-binding protein YceI